jgi:hypothetical protein
MNSPTRRLLLAAALVALAGPAAAQTWVYESNPAVRPYYQPRVYQSYAYQPVVTEPVARRTIVNRTIVRERIVTETPAPIVRERVVARPVVAESYAYAPVVRERVATRPVVYDDYAYSGYAYAPVVRERPIRRAVVVDRATDAYAMAPGVATATPVVTTAPAYRYRYFNRRLLLVDPVTGAVVGEVQD